MKKIEAVIRPERIDDVKDALNKVGVRGLTVAEVIGSGNQKGKPHTYRGTSFTLDLLPKIRVEVIAPDEDVEKIVDAICKAAATGEVGDGKIFISSIDEVIRVRTKERGAAAI